MLHLVLVRHGESIRNLLTDEARDGRPEGLAEHLRDCPEESEWPLTELGHEQARIAGEFVRREIGIEFGQGYCSPFLRARQTASELGLPVEFAVDLRLRERLWGDYPTDDYLPAQYIADLFHCAQPDWKAPFPNAESIEDLEPEAASFLTDLPREGSVIAVTHGGTLGAIQEVLEGHPPERHIGNCGVLEYSIARSSRGWTGRGRFACPAFGDAQFGDWVDF